MGRVPRVRVCDRMCVCVCMCMCEFVFACVYGWCSVYNCYGHVRQGSRFSVQSEVTVRRINVVSHIRQLLTRGAHRIGLDGYPIRPIVFHQSWIGFGYYLKN